MREWGDGSRWVIEKRDFGALPWSVYPPDDSAGPSGEGITRYGTGAEAIAAFAGRG